MTLPTTMLGLALKDDGFSRDTTGQALTDLSPYVELKEVPVPTPRAGQALIKVARAAVNPSDVAFIKGLYGQSRKKGTPAGFEGTGTVVSGDTPLIGKRVSFFGSISGTWAEYALTDAAGLIPVRDDLNDQDAAGLIVNPITAMAMFDIAKTDAEAGGADSFIATAAGSQLGKFLISLGRDEGLPCVAVVRRSNLIEPLTNLGAAAVLATDAEDYATAMPETLKTHAPRVMLDAVAGQVTADLFFAMQQRARWIGYGRLSLEPPTLTQMGQFIFMDKRIEGFWLTNWLNTTPRDKIAKVVAATQARFVEGSWKTDISATVPLENAMEALPAAYSEKDSKVLIAP